MRVSILAVAVAVSISVSAFGADVRDALAREYGSAVQRGASDADVSRILLRIVAESKKTGSEDDVYAAALDALAKISDRTGDYSNSAQWSEDAASIHAKLGDLRAAARAQEAAASARAALGQFTEAEQLFESSITNLKAASFPPGLNKKRFVEMAEKELGMMYLDSLQLDKAKAVFSAGVDQEARSGAEASPLGKISQLMNLARVHFLEQNWETFDDRIAELTQYLRETDLSDRQRESPMRELALLRTDGFIVRQKYDQAVESAEDGMAVASSSRLSKSKAALEHRHLLDRLAAVAAASGDADKAKEFESQFLRRFEPGPGGHHRTGVETLRRRARALADDGNAYHAEYLTRRLLDGVAGRDDYSTSATRQDIEFLAKIVRLQGRLQEAEHYEERARKHPSQK